MNLQEQIKAWQEQLAAAKAAQLEIMKKAAEDGTGRVLDDAEQKAFDGKSAEIEQVKAHIARLETLLEAEAAAATEPAQVRSVRQTQQRQAPAVIVSRNADDKFEGQSFTRLAIAKALAKINGTTPSTIAAHRWGKTNPMLVEWVRANEVAAGGAASGEWGAELVQADGRFRGDFIEFLYKKTVFDRLGLRPIPADVTIRGQDGAATGYWVGEGKAIPLSAQDFLNVTLSPLKVAGLAVITKDLLRRSDLNSEMLVRDGLINAATQRIDTTFVSATPASNGVSPAGILNGVSSLGSNGNDADAVRQNIAELYQPFIDNNNFSDLVHVMHQSLALQLSLMRNSFGQKEFPDMTPAGGTLEGFPVVTGNNVAVDDHIVLKPSDIYKIDDRGIDVSMSEDASIEMNSVPTGDALGPTAASEDIINLFQSDAVGIKVVRPISFAKRRSHAVQFIGDAYYGLSTPTA